MNYATVCSGIEAPSVAWAPLGWEPVFFSEIEQFPCAVLKHHYPDVPNYGDMTKYKEWPDHGSTVDVLCGGTPCQAFSVAGLRKGLDDPRGNLTLTYLGVVARYRPRWVVWENVPGVLSEQTGAFGAFIGGLAELGYGFAYRVLDAQYFGLAQRRKRVFVVGHSGGQWQRAAAVLFDSESLSWYPPPSREAGKRVAPCLSQSLKSSGGIGMSNQELFSQGGAGLHWEVAHSLRADGLDASEDGTGRGTPLVPEVAWCLQERDAKGSDSDTKEGHLIPVSFHPRQDPIHSNDCALSCEAKGPGAVAIQDVRGLEKNQNGRGWNDDGTSYTVDAHATQGVAAGDGMVVRRLTPRECERLQGFPDDYTRIPYRGKSAEQCPDGPRYKALGNSMAVPVVRWIGERIAKVDAL